MRCRACELSGDHVAWSPHAWPRSSSQPPTNASTLAFFLKSYAKFPAISRIYYFQLITKAECGKKRRGDFRCSLSEFGLLGSDDDNRYRTAVKDNDKSLVIPAPPRQNPEPSDRHYSKPGERRFTFCLMRDKKQRWLNKASRTTRDSTDQEDYCAP